MQVRGLQARLVELLERGCRHEQADPTAAFLGIPTIYATGAVFSLQRIQCAILLAFAAARSAAVGCLVLTSTTRRRTLTSGIAVRINSKTTRTTTTCKPFLTCCKSTSTPITLAVAG